MAIAMDMCDSRESWITWENVGRGGEGEIMDGLRGRRPSGVGHHGGLEYRST